MKLLFTCLLLSMALFSAAQGVVLKNSAGVEISAEILSVEGQTVTIRRDDGQVFSFPMNTLDAASQAAIQKWVKEAASRIPADAFRITTTEKTIDKLEDNNEMRKNEAKVVKVQVKIEYSHNVPLKNLELKYNLYYDEERIGRLKDEFTQEKVISDSVKIPLLGPNSTVEVMGSKAVELWESKMNPGFYPLVGERGPAEDDITGIWVRLYDGKKLLCEYSKPRTLAERNEWKAE